MNTSRRNLLKGFAGAAGIVALAGCTITKSGTTVTLTLNTKEVLDYGDSVLSFAQAGIALSFVASGLGAAGVSIATAAITELKDGLAAFNTAAKGAATISYNDASAKTAFNSILTAIKTIDTYIVATIAATVSDSTIVSEAKTAANAASGIISIIEGLIDSLTTSTTVASSLKADYHVAEIDSWLKTQTS